MIVAFLFAIVCVCVTLCLSCDPQLKLRNILKKNQNRLIAGWKEHHECNFEKPGFQIVISFGAVVKKNAFSEPIIEESELAKKGCMRMIHIGKKGRNDR